MEIDNLLKKIRNQEEEPNRFLALEITDEIVQTAVWQVKNAKTELVNIGTAEYWNGNKESKISEAVDKSLAKATEGLATEPEEVVFGLPHNWVKDDNITADKKELIKNISKELALKPLGFVVITESLIRYLKIREGTPATAILVHLTDSEVTVSLVTLGRIMATHAVGRSEDIARDVEEGISRFKVDDNLPSRIIVFNGMQDMEEIVQNLTSYDWQNKFKFLHLPKIEALPKDAGISAVAVAGGSEVAKSIGFEINFDEPKEPVPGQEPTISPPTTPPPTASINQESSLGDLGFVEGKDIGQMKKQSPAQPQPKIEKKPATPAPASRKPLPKPSLSFFSGFLGKLQNIRFPKLPLNFARKMPKGPIAVIGGALALLLISVFALLWFIPKTEVTLYLEPKNLEQSLDLTISERVTSPDQDNNIIPGTSVSRTVKGDKSTDATGTKIVGDPAKGEVTIFNRTSLEKTFPQGTIISYNSLDFSLDSEVTIASKSAGADYSEIPGKANVTITAEAIGSDSNLEVDKEFTVDDFSTDSFIANNESPLTGGTSEEMKVVSEEDRSRILEELTAELEEKAKSELMQEANAEKGVFIQDELTEVISSNFSAAAGEEVNSVTLTLEIETKGLAYNNNDVEQLITGNVEETMPSGYERADSPIEVETASTESNDDEVILDATIKVKLLPKVEKDVLATTIKNLKAADLEAVFKNIPGFERAEVSIQPRWLPPRWKSVSRNPKNINIEIKSL